MNKINKNDKVMIVNTNDIWQGKSGIVLSISDDKLLNSSGEDVTEVKVKVHFDSDNLNKSIIQTFPLNCLELYAVENLNEAVEDLADIDLNSKDDFINYFIGKKCKFKGFNYSELYAKHEQEDGTFEYDKEDLEYINYYRDLEKLDCEITSCVLIDSFDEFETPEENFNSAYWAVEFSNGDTLPAICGSDLELTENLFESLSKKAPDLVDYIRDYVYADSIDDENLPSWFFVNKIAAAENVTEDDVLKVAKYFKYKIYAIIANHFYKKVVAAPACTEEMIYNDYADYLNGTVVVKEV